MGEDAASPRRDGRLRTSAAVAAFAALLLPSSVAEPEGSSAAAARHTRLLPPSTGIYHGASPGFGATEDRVSTGRVKRFERLARKRIVWAYFSSNWFGGIRFPGRAVTAIARSGAIPFIRLMPRSDWTEGRVDRRYALGAIAGGRFDRALRRWARAAAATNIPLLVDFACEMNGDWFPWSGTWNGGGARTGYGNPRLADGPERYRAAYRHLVRLFRVEGARNVTWVFHVDADSTPRAPWNSMRAYYPGDDYVDWIGVSAYGAQSTSESWESLRAVLDRAYPRLVRISRGKPLMIAEFGIVENPAQGSKGRWIARALEAVAARRYPRIRGVSYWHANWQNEDGTQSRMRVDSSPNALAAYRDGISRPTFVVRARFVR
jgi:hypothetical protein